MEVYAKGQAPGTAQAKKRHLTRFLEFYLALYHHERASEWYPSVTMEFLRSLQDNPSLSQDTVCNVYAAVRHFARWIHKNRFAFPQGCPTDGVRAPRQTRPSWKGLERKNEVRIRNAARKMKTLPHPGTHQGERDFAFLAALAGSGLRVSEVRALDVAQWDGRAFKNVRQKGGDKRGRVSVHEKENRQAISDWAKSLGRDSGPLFPTRTGRPIGRQQAYAIVRRMCVEANAHLPEAERFHVTPHFLRHTLGRKLADKKGVHFARKQLGHEGYAHIGRYVEPDDEALEQALE